MERDTTFTFWEMTSAPELNRLSPSQRACRFMNEPMDDTIPVYSYNVCRMICRRKLALKLCGCIPHFYPYPGISYAILRNVFATILCSKQIRIISIGFFFFVAAIPNIASVGSGWVGTYGGHRRICREKNGDVSCNSSDRLPKKPTRKFVNKNQLVSFVLCLVRMVRKAANSKHLRVDWKLKTDDGPQNVNRTRFKQHLISIVVWSFLSIIINTVSNGLSMNTFYMVVNNFNQEPYRTPSLVLYD